jgi:hypothetical protein
MRMPSLGEVWAAQHVVRPPLVEVVGHVTIVGHVTVPPDLPMIRTCNRLYMYVSQY